ncbi:MAG: L-threonylcarbamoyladenylate synthase [Mariprofundales bacterium]
MVTFEHMRLHPERPQIRQIRHVVDLLRRGSFAIVPTETTYAIMMLCDALEAQQAVRKLRQLNERHLWSLVCQNISQAAKFVNIDNQAHRILKHHLPGPFTFVLTAKSKISRRVLSKRKDIGIRMPDHTVCQMLLQELDQPLLAASMQFPDEEFISIDPEDIAKRIKHLPAVLLDAGWGGIDPTTVVDLTTDDQPIIRQGLGDWPVRNLLKS